jgi:hypothetical protein
VREVADWLHLRRFCRIGLLDRLPEESTVRTLVRRLGAEVIDEMCAQGDRGGDEPGCGDAAVRGAPRGSIRPSCRPMLVIPRIWIRTGKLNAPTEFGFVMQITEWCENTRRGARGLILPVCTGVRSLNESQQAAHHRPTPARA